MDDRYETERKKKRKKERNEAKNNFIEIETNFFLFFVFALLTLNENDYSREVIICTQSDSVYIAPLCKLKLEINMMKINPFTFI